MLAPHDLPPAYVQWNAAHRAPFGRSVGRIAARVRLGGMSAAAIRFRGPFAWQGNNTTREFEYPWAQEQIAAHGSQLDVVDVGGGLSGLQWVLAREGHRVVNVDPGFAAGAAAFGVDSPTHA